MSECDTNWAKCKTKMLFCLVHFVMNIIRKGSSLPTSQCKGDPLSLTWTTSEDGHLILGYPSRRLVDTLTAKEKPWIK